MAELNDEQKALQEKLKNMSPEELAEFQKQQCIFCHIVSGKVASKKIYEDEKCVVILDINPANPGHVLVIPKEHYMIMPQVPEEVLTHMTGVVKQVSLAALRALSVKGTNIIVQNGVAAGQRAQHFMIHIIPRQEGDGVPLTLTPGKAFLSAEEKQALSTILQQKHGEQPQSTTESLPPAEPSPQSDSSSSPEQVASEETPLPEDAHDFSEEDIPSPSKEDTIVDAEIVEPPSQLDDALMQHVASSMQPESSPSADTKIDSMVQRFKEHEEGKDTAQSLLDSNEEFDDEDDEDTEDADVPATPKETPPRKQGVDLDKIGGLFK